MAPTGQPVVGRDGAHEAVSEQQVAGELRGPGPAENQKIDGAGAYLGTNVVFTNSGVFSPATVLGAVLEVGADAVMFSVDYPYESSHEAVAGFERTVLSDSDREKVAHGNAERLLRL